MLVKDLIAANRSFRRFDENVRISLETLRSWVDLARLGASAANRQPLKYVLINEPEGCDAVFRHLAWAAYLTDWKGPEEGQRPAAYIVVLGDAEIASNYWCDHGIAAQNILLGAVEQGLGGCILGGITKREVLHERLGLPANLEILLVLALGKPAEKVKLEPVDPGGSIKYWRDSNDVHHVPKRGLDEVVVAENPNIMGRL